MSDVFRRQHPFASSGGPRRPVDIVCLDQPIEQRPGVDATRWLGTARNDPRPASALAKYLRHLRDVSPLVSSFSLVTICRMMSPTIYSRHQLQVDASVESSLAIDLLATSQNPALQKTISRPQHLVQLVTV